MAAIFAVLLLTLPAGAGQKLRGHVPTAVPNLQPLDRLPASQQMDFSIGLPLRNEAGLDSFLAQLYDPASTNYHQYLSQEQFVARFGPTKEDYQAMIAFARAHHFKIIREHSNQTLLELRGSVADIESTFHLNMRVYQHPNPSENRRFFAPDQEPELDLTTPVLDITGLDNFVVPKPMDLKIKPANPSMKPAAASGSGPSGNYIGKDFRAAYVPGVTLTGAGQSVGLLEFDGYYANDIASYKSLAGLPDVTVTNVLLSYSGAAGSDNTEVALDIEMAMSMAPGLSQIIVYEGVSGNTILTQMLEDNIAKQLSASWTYSINGTTTNLFHQFWAQGISYFNAAGDSGAYTGTVSSPADDPYIMSVGGTSLTTSGRGGPYASETVWNWFGTGQGSYAGSGGISTVYPLPTWQQGLATTANGGSTAKRNLPDIALTADNIYVISDNGGGGEVGGTSAACPLWAAFTALVNQQSVANGQGTVGFLNPALYAIGKSAYYPTAFHDITTGNNTNTHTTTKFFARAGYDLCTGWGTPKGAALIAALAPSSPLILTPPTNVVASLGSAVNFSVTAVGAGALNYQWQFNSTNIASATNSSYAISSAQFASQGTYSVIVSNSFGLLTSPSATLIVYVLPSITTQPQSQEISQGGSATFTAAASGTPAPAYQWRFNNVNISSATDSNLTINGAQLANQGNYTVVAANLGGSVTSSIATLTVDTPPAIVTGPTSQVAVQGAPVSFAVNVTGSTPLLYQWVYDGGNILQATNATYSIASSQVGNSGSYYVIVGNSFGTVTSAVATLTVNAPPAITGAPQGQSLIVGNNASFAVSATGTAPLGYQWLRNGIGLADNGHVTGSLSANLSINSVLVSDAGNYQVVITNVAGVTTSGVAVLSVAKVTPTVSWSAPAAINYGTALGSGQLNATANYPGTFAYIPASGVTPNAGTNKLAAVFTPSDTLDYNTVTDAVSLVVLPGSLTLTASNAMRVYGETNPVFTATVTGAVNGDVFTATASSAAAPTNLPGTYPIVPTLVDASHRAGNYLVTTDNGTLTVTPAAAPTIISVTPNSGTTNGGNSVTILGTGFEAGATVNFGGLFAASVNVTNATNIIAVTPAASLGQVDVILTNADGQSAVLTNGYTFVMPLPPEITGQPTNQSASPGGSATFTVTATGTSLTYQWALNNNALTNATNFTLALSNVQPADAGPYQVVVSNAFGAATSSVATLSILGVPASFVTGPGGIQYSNGQFVLQVGGLTGQGLVVIQTSTDLINWVPIFTNPPAFGQFQFVDPNASNSPSGYYRAVTLASP